MAKAERKEMPEFRLPENYVPQFNTALPEWAANASEAVVREANVKGSPGFDPSPEQAHQVEQMVALGMADQEISAILRIEPKLLQKYYKYELETARGRINQAVARIALQMALSGALPDMTRFWLKTRAGWKETKVTEITGKDGGAIEFMETKRRLLEAIEAEISDIEYTDGETLQ